MAAARALVGGRSMTPRFVIESARLAGPPLLRCQSDQRLIELVRAGNDRAFEAIVDRYRRPLLRYCARMLTPERAEDVLQQTFLNAYGAIHRNEAAIDLRPWLYRIARNACLNALRETGWSHEPIDRVRGGAESAHETVERRHELDAIVTAVRMLPERQREAVVLRELEGRSYDHIADQLDATDGAVRQLLNRARTTLRAGATAVTPVALLARVPWVGGQPALAQISEGVVSQEGVRSGTARAAGIVAASLALIAGLTQEPGPLRSATGSLGRALSDPASLPSWSARAPLPPLSQGAPAPTAAGITLMASFRVPTVVDSLEARASGAPGNGLVVDPSTLGSKITLVAPRVVARPTLFLGHPERAERPRRGGRHGQSHAGRSAQRDDGKARARVPGAQADAHRSDPPRRFVGHGQPQARHRGKPDREAPAARAASARSTAAVASTPPARHHGAARAAAAQHSPRASRPERRRPQRSHSKPASVAGEHRRAHGHRGHHRGR